MSAAPLYSAFRSSLSEAWASGAGLLLPLGFFAGTAMMVPFSLGSEAELLSRVGPGILWLALALSSMVTLERVFQADLQDGALDLWLQDTGSISLIAAIKTLSHWLVSGFPLVLLTPLIGFMLGVPTEKMLPAMWTASPIQKAAAHLTAVLILCWPPAMVFQGGINAAALAFQAWYCQKRMASWNVTMITLPPFMMKI